MRLPNMSSNFLLAPIPETADFFTIRDVKMAVMGSNSVGKTAMVVRFLTKRFIGDYEANTGENNQEQSNKTPADIHVQIKISPMNKEDTILKPVREYDQSSPTDEADAAKRVWKQDYTEIGRKLSLPHIVIPIIPEPGMVGSGTCNLYSRLVQIEGEQMYLQIQDTPGCIKVEDDVLQADISRYVQWAEGFLLVYSVTDYRSYQCIRPLYQHIRKMHADSRIPIIIVANKGDLLHVRQVPSDSGIQLANELGCAFVEISTSENCQDVCEVFQHLCKEISKVQSIGIGEKRRGSLIPRPKSPNMQDLKRRFKQALSPKVKASSTVA